MISKIIAIIVLCAMLASHAYGGKELPPNLVKVIRTMTSLEVLGVRELSINSFGRMNKLLNIKREPYVVNPLGRMDEDGFNEIKDLTDDQITVIIHIIFGDLTATGKLDEDEIVGVMRKLKYDTIDAFQALKTYRQVDAIRQLTNSDFFDLTELTLKEIKEIQEDEKLNEQVDIISKLTDYEFYGFKQLGKKQANIVRKLTQEQVDIVRKLAERQVDTVRNLTQEQWYAVRKLTDEQLDAVWKLTDAQVEVLENLTTEELYMIREESQEELELLE